MQIFIFENMQNKLLKLQHFTYCLSDNVSVRCVIKNIILLMCTVDVCRKLCRLKAPPRLRIFNVNRDGSSFVDLIAKRDTRANVRIGKPCEIMAWD